MKKILFLLMVIIIVAGTAVVQAQKAKWTEMEAFHTTMAQTFHPAEEGKLEPVKTRSQEILDKASTWKSSKAPEGYDQKAVKKPLAKLVKGAKELNKLVKENAPDATIKEKISSLHDVFHQIMEKCEKDEHM
jgi:hypothetical protein